MSPAVAATIVSHPSRLRECGYQLVCWISTYSSFDSFWPARYCQNKEMRHYITGAHAGAHEVYSPMEVQQHPAVVRINEAIALLRISRSRFYKGMRNGEIPIAYFCGLKRIPRAWIDAEIKKALDTMEANST